MVAMPSTAQYQVSHLPRPINTPGNETGACLVGDTVLVYGQMTSSEGKNSQFHFDNARTVLMQARVSRSGKISRPTQSKWRLNVKGRHTSNLTVDPASGDLYFTRAEMGDPELRCEIWWARRAKRGWEKPQRLKGAVNVKGTTSTQPAVAHLEDGTTILYFASNREGGVGGMDIWYSLVKEGVGAEPVNLGPRVNSAANEITPYYDPRNGVLYFSSDRKGGKGGYDIYCTAGQRNTWQAAEPVCACLNSEQNDIYFTISEHDSATGIPLEGYLVSNRRDSYFLNDSMCCNDIYQWTLDSLPLIPLPPIDSVLKEKAPVVAAERQPVIFPLFLYFLNDDPDPKSRSRTTEASYTDCQIRYLAQRTTYVGKQRSDQDSAMMEEFFDSCVVGNYQRVEALLSYLEGQLSMGKQVTLAIAGYASPLFKSDYNQFISHRRITAFTNMIQEWHNGALNAALHTGQLTITQQPHGAVSPTTRSRSTDPVYGLPAALARRIEIRSCDVR